VLGHGAPPGMRTANRERSHTARKAVLAIVAGFAFYVATVGSIPAIGRHMEDGCLQWMRGSSVASRVLEIYGWPAQHLAAFPAAGWLFDLSAEFWYVATDAPETTG